MNVVSLSVGMQHHIRYKICERVSSGFLHLLLLKCYYYYWYFQYCCFKVIKTVSIILASNQIFVSHIFLATNKRLSFVIFLSIFRLDNNTEYNLMIQFINNKQMLQFIKFCGNLIRKCELYILYLYIYI